ncbi:MAG TPA: hypothetical protein DCX89_08365 [Saprospirales bacterium]|nr:hypothetical protein [Saprospirales bacterium]
MQKLHKVSFLCDQLEINDYIKKVDAAIRINSLSEHFIYFVLQLNLNQQLKIHQNLRVNFIKNEHLAYIRVFRLHRDTQS